MGSVPPMNMGRVMFFKVAKKGPFLVSLFLIEKSLSNGKLLDLYYFCYF